MHLFLLLLLSLGCYQKRSRSRHPASVLILVNYARRPKNLKDLIITGELHENTVRKDFAMSERVAILDAIERQRKGGNLPPYQKGKKSRDITALYTGVSERQLSKEKLVVKAAAL
jgi:hypothetical protein